MAEKERKLTKKAMDELWMKDKEEEGWVLPKKANRFLRLPVIRYFRWFGRNLTVWIHNNIWMRAGLIPSGYDEWVLYAIYRGWC